MIERQLPKITIEKLEASKRGERQYGSFSQRAPGRRAHSFSIIIIKSYTRVVVTLTPNYYTRTLWDGLASMWVLLSRRRLSPRPYFSNEKREKERDYIQRTYYILLSAQCIVWDLHRIWNEHPDDYFQRGIVWWFSYAAVIKNYFVGHRQKYS